NLGDQLAGQVEQLRSEQEQLRSDAEELSTKNDQLATFVAELGPDLVAGTLADTQVAVITDDSSTRPGIERIMTLLGDAGVEAPARIQLQPGLWAPDAGEERAATLEEIREIAPAALTPDPDGELSDSAQLSGLIPTLLRGGGTIPAELRSQVWQVLIDHQMVVIEGSAPVRADAVIYTGAAPEELSVETEDEAVATERAQELLASQTHLLTERGDRAVDGLSTTDRLQEPDGPLLAVLALIEQTRGGAGSYGTTSDAEERLPDLPETQGLDSVGEDQGTGSEDAAPQPSDGGGEG